MIPPHGGLPGALPPDPHLLFSKKAGQKTLESVFRLFLVFETTQGRKQAKGSFAPKFFLVPFSWKKKEPSYCRMTVPVFPATPSRAFSSKVMRADRPGADRANSTAAWTLGSMEPGAKWPSAM